MRPTCKNCAYFECDIRMGNGEPMASLGECVCKLPAKTVQADDWCNKHDFAEWAEEAGA